MFFVNVLLVLRVIFDYGFEFEKEKDDKYINNFIVVLGMKF